MSALKYLLVKEYKQMFRNRLLPIVFIIVPVVFMNIVPRIATQEIDNLNVAVIDNDHSTLSSRLIQRIDASRHFALHSMHNTHSAAFEDIKQNEADIILTIPSDFERNLYRNGTAEVQIDANAVNGMKGGLGNGYLTQIVQRFFKDEINPEFLTSHSSLLTPNSSLKINPRFLYNQSLDYKAYMIPALMVMILVLLVGFLPALNIVGEKERGTIEQINVTPIGRFEFILSKMIPYWSVGIFIILLSMLMAWKIHGVSPQGSVALILLFNLAGILTISSLALTVSNYSDTMRQGAITMFFFVVIFILTSGLLSPISSMPEWAQQLTRLNPLRYLMTAMREIYLKGSTLTQLLPQFIPLCIYGIAAGIWALLSYQKNE